MDRSHSRSASPREPARPQHRPPSPPSPPAFENRAYQHDESDPNHNDSFNSNGPQQNGHSKEPNGDTKTLEAVNLELINLTPKNGSSKQKKDVEVDLNASNPYDEYFVPVNEHRKYMRGEKLYVTADKRGEKGGCKRPLCWTLLGLVVAAIVALIVLAATGILFTNSPTPLEPYNTSVSSARALGGITHSTIHDKDLNSDHDHNHDHDHDHDHNHDHEHHHDHEYHHTQDHDHEQATESEQNIVHEQNTENIYNQEPQSSPEDNSSDKESQEHTHDHDQTSTSSPEQHHGVQIQNDEGPGQSITSEESNDSSMYVPRTLEGELKIDNEEFTAEFEDPESDEYREFVASFSDALKRALFDRNTLENGDNDIVLEVVKIKSGSILVTYRIHWDPRYNTQSSENILTPSTLQANLNAYLAQNNRMISIYHISEDKMTTRLVLDMCQINHNDCEYGCEFDKSTLDFVCTCPHGQILDMKHSKKCMSLLDNTHGIENSSHVGVVTSGLNTSNPASDEEKPITESVHTTDKEIRHNKFDWKQTNHHIAETTTESDSDLNFSHIFGNPSDQNEIHKTEISKLQPDSREEQDVMSTLDEDFPQSTTLKPFTTISEVSLKTTTHDFTLEPAAEPEPISEPQTEPKSTVVTEHLEQNFLNQENKKGEAENPEPNPEPEPVPKLIPVTSTMLEPQPTPEPQPTTELNLPHTSDIKLQSAFTNVMSSEHMTTDSLGSDQTRSLTTDLPSVIMTDNKYDSKSNFNYDNQFEITTMKISSSEQSSPEITTNFNINNQQKETNNDDNTTTENDWLEDITEKSQTRVSETSTQINEFALLDHSMEHGNIRATELRSSKAYSNEFLVEDTTYQTTTLQLPDSKIESKNTTSEDFSFEQITNSYEIPTTKMTGVENVEDSTDRSTSAVSISQIFGGKYGDQSMNNVSLETTTKAILTGIEETRQIFNTVSIENKTIEENKENKSQTSLFEGVSINSSKSEHSETTTPVFEPVTEYSIAKQEKKSTIDESLITALKKTNNSELDEVKSENNVTTEKDFPEGDITFDAINKLYNRSSKSFVNKNVNVEAVSETNDVFIESSETTTSSDWLSETVTEINYEESINKHKNFETTEASVTKIDYVMSRGSNKDDFEPDYLNMGSNTSKNLEHDEPLYGMLHDYDNDESAIKRVKNEPSEIIEETTINNAVETPVNEAQIEKNITTLKIPTEMDKTFETTTVSEYIYKSSMNGSKSSSINTSDNRHITYSVPPVWESPEDNANFTFEELSKQVIEDAISESNISISTIPTTMRVYTQNYSNQDIMNTLEYSAPIDNVTQSNLNVTIYEISSENSNNNSVEKSVNHQSAEYDDHETEMNPFLPEIENNKSLVKKLQEGHDLEPSNVNETQNENAEEQPHAASDGNMASNDQVEDLNNKTTVSSIVPQNIRTITEANDALFNELLMHQNKDSSEEGILPSVDIIKDTETTPSPFDQFDNDSKESSDQKDVLPISTFLLDTDDLDTTKELLNEGNVKSEISTKINTMAPITLSETTTENKIKIGEENQFLSVVPIEEENSKIKETLKNNYERENIPEFNLISDSPKKSGRRTLESINIQSDTNNEA